MKKKLFSIFTLLCLAVTSAWADENGSCGTSVTYSYVESTHTLTISGSGDMADYVYNSQPWNSYKDNITSVVIESGVTSIGQNAFAYCSNLTSVTIPASVTTIGESAFYACEKLASVTIPSSVTSIGNQAFSGCTGLTSVTFDGTPSLTTIGNNAFYNCSNTNLTSIVIPASVTSIGNSAFESCSNLASVTVFAPTTCTLGSVAFNDCTNLQIYVPSDLVNTFKTNWSTYTDKITAIGGNCGATATWSLNSSGVLTISGSGAMANYEYDSQPWKGYRTSITSVVIESGVTSIGNWAFRDCTGLTSVTIPASVTSIGEYAFYACEKLTSVTIPASVTSIGNSAFKDCYNLTSVTVYSTSCTLGTQAFNNCASGLQIKVFSDLVGIYKGKENWSTYTDKITAIGGNCGATATWSLNSYGVLTISGSGAMTDLVSEADQPWKGYRTSITSVVIGSGVTSIGQNAFYFCDGLTSVTIPASVTSIGEYAFNKCTGLTSIEIPSSVTSIGVGAFWNCPALETITVDQNNPKYDSGNGCNAIIKTDSKTLVVGCKNTVIPSSVTSIGEFAFFGCSGLTSIDIPSSVTSIDDCAFENCTGLTSVTIPSSVTSIGEAAFYNCSALTSVTVFSASCTLGTQAFNGCTNLANIYVFSDLEETFKNSTTGWSAYSGKITAMTNPHGKCGASDHESDVRWVLTGTSPNYTLTIMKVGSTGAMANYGDDNQPWKDYRSNIKSVVIVNGVTTIGDGAFMACSNLATVTFDGNSQPISFNLYAFSGCGFTSVTIPSNVTSIGDFTFSGCPNLTEVNIGKGVTSIENHAFNSCPKLTTITVDTENTKYDSRDNCNAIIETASKTLVLGCKDTFIPNTVTSIGDAAFWKCAGLTSIAIPASVTSIGASAFKECPDLTSVTFATGSQLTSIGVLAFYDCKSLASIEIPSDVMKIGDHAFFGCSSLTSIDIPASVKSIGEDAFVGCTNVTDVYCYANPDNLLTWTDNFCNDFIDSPAKTTVCHVAGSKLATYESKWSTGSNDVNVTFMGDGFEPGGKAYLVKAITYKSGTMPDGVKAFLPVDYDLSTGTVTLAEVTGAPKGLPVIYGPAAEGEAMPGLFFQKYVADGSDADKAIQTDYDTKAGDMSKRFVITDGEQTLAEILAGITDVPANEALFLVLANGKFNTVNVSAADLEKKAKPGLLLFVLSKWEYMHLGSSSDDSPVGPIGARIISIGGDDGTATGIEAVQATSLRSGLDGDAWHDLQGRRLSEKPARKGLYIRNGKKVVIK